MFIVCFLNCTALICKWLVFSVIVFLTYLVLGAFEVLPYSKFMKLIEAWLVSTC